MSTDLKRRGIICVRCGRKLDNPTGRPTYCEFCLQEKKRRGR